METHAGRTLVCEYLMHKSGIQWAIARAGGTCALHAKVVGSILGHIFARISWPLPFVMGVIDRKKDATTVVPKPWVWDQPVGHDPIFEGCEIDRADEAVCLKGYNKLLLTSSPNQFLAQKMSLALRLNVGTMLPNHVQLGQYFIYVGLGSANKWMSLPVLREASRDSYVTFPNCSLCISKCYPQKDIGQQPLESSQLNIENNSFDRSETGCQSAFCR